MTFGKKSTTPDKWFNCAIPYLGGTLVNPLHKCQIAEKMGIYVVDLLKYVPDRESHN